MAGSKLQAKVQSIYSSDVMVVDCRDSLLDCYGWIKVVFELRISKEICDLKTC